ncbi:MAG: ABC transporter permease [Planctomycetes bacterium]|nr:ABC transporter permease [Planctomycetota bacterium]
MNILDSILLALETLRTNKVRSLLTMLGILIGVVSVILLVSIGEGAKYYVSSQVASLGTNILIVFAGKTETHGTGPPILQSVNKLTVQDALALGPQCPSIKLVAPAVVGNTELRFENRIRNCSVIGTTNEFQEVRHLRVEVGSFLPEMGALSESRICVLGRTVKRELFGEENPLGRLIAIGGTKFRVVGVMARKGRTLGMDIDDFAFIPVRSAMRLFNTEGLLEVIISVVNSTELKRAQAQVKEVLMRRHDNHEDFTVVDQGDMLSVLNTMLTALTYALAGIAGISLLVGGIGIMNILLVSVGERTREIGLRKAIGAKRRDILAQFLIESVVLSSVGGLLGLVLGLTTCFAAGALIPDLPIRVSAWSLVMAVGVSFGVGVFFGVYPARRASLLNPIEALRHE